MASFFSWQLEPRPEYIAYGTEQIPPWQNIANQEGVLHAPTLLYFARVDIEAALLVLRDRIADIPEDHKPQTLDDAVDLIGWENPDLRTEFIDLATRELEKKPYLHIIQQQYFT